MSASRACDLIPGPRKAAILLAVLGEEAATLVVRGMPHQDAERVAQELATLEDISPEVSEQVLAECFDLVAKQEEQAMGGLDYTRRLLLKAFGEDVARTSIEKISEAHSRSRADLLRKVDPQQLAKLLETEHPQTVALMLGSLDSKQGSSLLMELPQELRAEVVKRLANLRHCSTEIGERVSTVFNRRLEALDAPLDHTFAGDKSVAELMNRLDANSAREILESIETSEPDLAIQIREMMFTFDDFLEVPEQQIRELMGAIDRKVLTLALKGTNEELKNHFFRTMSSRAVEMLKEDTEALGPVRSREIAKAQQEIVAVARRLEAEGKLVLRNDGEDEYVV